MDLPADPFRALVAILALLRGDPGCPWDKKQDHRTLIPYLVEEAYEVVDAIEDDNLPHMKEELGDLLLQIVFHAQIASETAAFTIDDVSRGIVDKMIRRHPHVFGDAVVKTAEDVIAQWEEIKLQEKGASRQSLMDGMPSHLPALLWAERVQKRASEVGFDWKSHEGALAKVQEEARELAEATDQQAMLDEYGDLLFSVVALGRHLGLSAEDALRAGVRRFVERFKHMESHTSQPLSSLHEDDWRRLWDEARKPV